MANQKEKLHTQLNSILENGDTTCALSLLGGAAKSANISKLSRETGISREGLYHALSDKGNPTFATILKISKALGLKLHFEEL